MKRFLRAGRKFRKKDVSCCADGKAGLAGPSLSVVVGGEEADAESGEVSESKSMESYRYAMHQYSNTVEPSSSYDTSINTTNTQPYAAPPSTLPPFGVAEARFYPPPPPPGPPPMRRSLHSNPNPNPNHHKPADTSPNFNLLHDELPQRQETLTSTNTFSDESHAQAQHQPAASHTCRPEPTMPDATYEENYGDAYVGGPIKYVYPSGYQAMRPRSGPWKLSIAVCVLFLWLTVFIVGHCSDRVDMSSYPIDNDQIDDDQLVIETRWCGSKLLYFMWVVSVMITGVATAYVGIIGYIKVRDFAVANCRSQPPGMLGKSDYYVRLEDVQLPRNQNNYANKNQYSSYQTANNAQPYRTNIYQSDGTPQFWGGHIYRPTQAAVAVTSR